MGLITGVKDRCTINSWDFSHHQDNVEEYDYIAHNNDKNNPLVHFFKKTFKENVIKYAKENNLYVDQISSIIGNKMVSIPIDQGTIV